MNKSVNRIDQCFFTLKQRGQKALLAFVTAGDPNLEKSAEFAISLCQAGIDILELGIPFSDPMADGPVIQRSSQRALGSGMTLLKTFELVKMIRKKSNIPIILMGYFNPILAMGLQKFCKDLKEVGADGVLVVDLPFEESGDFQTQLKKNDLHQIFLLSPTSTPKRIDNVCKIASGFLYFISIEGTTGGKLANIPEIKKPLEIIQGNTQLPVVIGFGIRNSKQAKDLASISDGVVIGSALIENLEGVDFKEGKEKAIRFIQEIKKGS